MEKLLKPGITPFPHQIEAFNEWGNKKAFALLLEQGAGKTLVMIAKLGELYKKGEINKALIISPVSVAPELEIQFEDLAGYPVEVKVLAGLKANKKAEALKGWKKDCLQVAIINYESTWCKGRSRKKKWEVMPELAKWSPDIVICDESQRIKNANSKQSKAIFKLGQEADYRGILTGTIIAESPLDFFGQYKFLEPSILGTSYRAFEDQYAVKGGYRGYQVIGHKNLDELAKITLKIACRKLKKDCVKLPPVIPRTIPVELEPSAKALYKEMDKEMILDLQGETITAPLVITKNMKLSQITGGYITTPDENGKKKIIQVSSAKLKVTMDKLEDLLYNKSKVIIFTRFIPEIDGLVTALKKRKIKYSEISGRIKDRKAVIKDFQNPKSKTQVMVVQIATGGVGITLTAADVAIFYSTDYSNINYEQAKARIDRIGQKAKRVLIYHLVAKGTIDGIISKALINKQDVSKALLDNYFSRIGKKQGGNKKMKRFKQEEFVLPLEDREIEVNFEGVNKPKTKPPVVMGDATRDELNELLEELKEELEKGGADNKNLFDDLRDLPSNSKSEKRKERRESKKIEKALKESKVEKDKKVKTPKGPKLEGDVITIAMLAEEVGVEPKKLRKKLRDKFTPASGRWEWSSDDPQLEEVRKFLGI